VTLGDPELGTEVETGKCGLRTLSHPSRVFELNAHNREANPAAGGQLQPIALPK
jgi:hypothetical protein